MQVIGNGIQRIRLFGLVLIVGTLMLSVVALGTGTSSVRIRDPRGLLADLTGTSPVVPPPSELESASQSGTGGLDVQFVRLHVAVPLVVAGLAGVLLWATPELFLQRSRSGRRRVRKRR